MSSQRGTAALRVTAPSLCVLAVAVLGLAVGSYWQYVLAVSLSAAIVGGALAMLAIGAYGAAVPVVRLGVPFLAALAFATVLGALAGIVLAVPGVRFRSHNLAMVTFVFQAVVIIALRESKGLTG